MSENAAMSWSELGLRQQVLPGVGWRLDMAGQVQFGTGEGGEQHAHLGWEILLVTEGRCVLLTERGDSVINNQHAVVIPPGLRHTVRCHGKSSMTLYYLSFSFEGIQVTDNALDQVKVLVPSAALQSLQQDVLDCLQRTQDWFGVLAAIQALLPELGISTGASTEQGLVASIIDQLEQQRDRPINVSELAHGLYRSPGYIGELFVAETGRTIKQYHRALRMNEAAKRLCRPGGSVSKVAKALGFSSSQVLSREFAKWFGYPPSQHARRQKQGDGA